jgi:hypothetical protein
MDTRIISKKIIELRHSRVMLDFHLAELYGVETRVLKQAVRRNLKRFPHDFMFQLTKDEWQEVITSCDNLPANAKFSPAVPFAFTEQGVAMLSSVLKSEKAVQVNIAIMRAFVLLRQYLMDYRELQLRIEKLEKEMNRKFKDIHEALNYLLDPPQPRKRPIGFKPDQ